MVIEELCENSDHAVGLFCMCIETGGRGGFIYKYDGECNAFLLAGLGRI